MRNLKRSLIALLAVVAGFGVSAQYIETPRPSPAQKVSQTVGISTVTVKYSRPAVNGRQIWGQVVPYGIGQNPGFGTGTEFPWRAGANENTIIMFSHDAKVEGQDIAAGKYGLHMGVNEDGSATVIFSTNTTSWGSFFYTPDEDALRVNVQTRDVEFNQERLIFDFMNLSNTSAEVVLRWGKKEVPFKVEFATTDLVIAKAAGQLRDIPGATDWNYSNQAAGYVLTNGGDIKLAEKWASQSVGIQQNFNNTSLLAMVHLRKGDLAMYDSVMTTAMEHPTATVGAVYTAGRGMINFAKANQYKDKEIMEAIMGLFEKLEKKWPEHWLAPHGMARAYSAHGDFKKALKYEEKALQLCPPGSKQFLEGFVQNLKDGQDFN